MLKREAPGKLDYLIQNIELISFHPEVDPVRDGSGVMDKIEREKRAGDGY